MSILELPMKECKSNVVVFTPGFLVKPDLGGGGRAGVSYVVLEAGPRSAGVCVCCCHLFSHDS